MKTMSKCCVFSGSVLKLIAVLTMMIDHCGVAILRQMPQGTAPLVHSISLYSASRAVGRTAFPIYCFLIGEGFRHTRSRVRYGRNLLLFALISEIPWNLMHSGTLQYEKQNVFFTLFLGFCSIAVYERFRRQRPKMLAGLLCLLLCALLLNADYGIRGTALILLLYLLHDDRILQGFFGCCYLNEGAATLPAFVLTGLYSGERGFIKGRGLKFLFYAVYPLHLLILYLLQQRLFGN